VVESPLLTAISRVNHASSQLTAGFPLQGYQHQAAAVLPTLTTLTLRQGPPTAHSRTRRLPPPHHTLSASLHRNASVPTNSLGPGLPAPSTCSHWSGTSSCQCRLRGCGNCIPTAGKGRRGIIARGMGKRN